MKQPLVVKFEYEDPDTEDEPVEVELPGRYEVCDRCEGHGTHVNPAIDGNGITSEEWNGPDWDEDSREMYLNGGYDVPCEECGGARLVVVVDTAAVEHGSDELKRWYAAYCDDQKADAEYEAICRAERHMGA